MSRSPELELRSPEFPGPALDRSECVYSACEAMEIAFRAITGNQKPDKSVRLQAPIPTHPYELQDDIARLTREATDMAVPGVKS